MTLPAFDVDEICGALSKASEHCAYGEMDRVQTLLGEVIRSIRAAPTVSEEQVQRFLTWPVPADVYPDGVPGQPGRTGTNLLSAHQARQMLEHVVAREG